VRTTISNALSSLFQDASDRDRSIDVNDVFSGTSEMQADRNTSEEMFRLVGLFGTAVAIVLTITACLHI